MARRTIPPARPAAPGAALLAALLAAALLLALPTGAAGTERDPDMTSPRDMAHQNGDLLAVWFEDDPQGIRVSIKVAGFGPRDTLAIAYVKVRLEDSTVTPAIGVDANGRVRTDSGANPGAWGGPGLPARVDDALAQARLQRGGPATFSFVIPWGLYGLEPGQAYQPLSAATSVFDGRTQTWRVGYDQAAPPEPLTLVAAAPGAAPAPAAGPEPLALLAAATLAGAALGAAAHAWARR